MKALHRSASIATLAGLVVALTGIFAAAGNVKAAGSTVGNGSASSCTEAALRSAVASGGPITFNCGNNATIALTQALTITADTDLDGKGKVTLDGQGNTRLVHVSTGVKFSTEKIALINGSAKSSDGAGNGAGLWNEGGDVTLTDTTIDAGSADHDGAAIYNQDGTLMLMRTTLSNGQAKGDGGALYVEKGTVTLGNVTVSGNVATGNGGGLFNAGGAVKVINVTFYKNEASGDGRDVYESDGQIMLSNTIIANPALKPTDRATLTNCKDVTVGNNAGKNIMDGGHNLQYPEKSCGDGIMMGNPRLSVLGDYGSYTKTHALFIGSLAIDRGSAAVCEAAPISRLDQRQVERPDGDARGSVSCDIGAYEVVPAPPTPVPVPTLTPVPQISYPNNPPSNNPPHNNPPPKNPPPPPPFSCPPGMYPIGNPPHCVVG
ncbi:MAG TPA: choice-of-anchor Q domain-containing protein [Aggregatilineales bacterium]|nr:choice-of-anchor Q domain-containing protein [Aggregatilineales bacterium]